MSQKASGLVSGIFGGLASDLRDRGLIGDGFHDTIVSGASAIDSLIDPVVSPALRTFFSWKRISIGGLFVDELVYQVREHGFIISDGARYVVRHSSFPVAKKSFDLSLVRVEVFMLGFTERPTFSEIVSRAQELELVVCPAETALHLRLALPNQTREQQLFVAMEPRMASEGAPVILSVENMYEGKWLDITRVDEHIRWALDSEFVFCVV